MSSILWGQNMEQIQLGIVKGELEKIEGSLNWINHTEADVSGRIWTDKHWFFLPRKDFSVPKGDTLTFKYAITISQALGLQQAEVRLLDNDNIILHGFLLKARFLPADTLALTSYRNEFFPFKAKEQVFNIGSGFTNREFSKTFTLYNFGGDSLDLSQISTKIEHLKILFSPVKIAHNQFTRMELIYSPDNYPVRGFVRENLSLFDKDKKLVAVLPIQYTLEDNRSSAVRDAPKLSLSKVGHDFKVMKAELTKQVAIKISNTGMADLKFYKIESNCECLTYSLKDEILSPGQSSELIVKFNSKERRGFERKTLAIFSNDPNEPTKVLVFKAHVK